MKTKTKSYINSIPKLSNWYRRFRIVRDKYCGYSVECWRVWFPFWIQYDCVNTFGSIDECVEFVRTRGEVVRYL